MASNNNINFDRYFVFFFLMMVVSGLLIGGCTTPLPEPDPDEPVNPVDDPGDLSPIDDPNEPIDDPDKPVSPIDDPKPIDDPDEPVDDPASPVEFKRVQYVLGGGSASGFTAQYKNNPKEGNLLVAISGNRLGLISPSVPGWELLHVEIGDHDDNNLRRSIALWSKIAGPSESKNVNINWNGESNRDAWVILQEFEGVNGYELAAVRGQSNVGSKGGITNLLIPSSPISIQKSSGVLVIGGMVWREGVANPVFKNKNLEGLLHHAFVDRAGHTVHGATGFAHAINGNDAWQTTVSWTNLRDASSGFLAIFSKNGEVVPVKEIKECVGDLTRSCSITNGKGQQSRTCIQGEWSSWSTCAITSCNSGYELKNNQCVLIKTPIKQVDNFIKISSKNPRYWEYKGELVLLLGGSYEDNLFQFPNWYYDKSKYKQPAGMSSWTLEEHLDALVDVGGNYVRNTMSSRNPGNRFPFKKIKGTPGDNKPTDTYDLNQWDDEYWNRFENFLKLTSERDIIVQIEIWDRFDFFKTEATSSDPLYRGIDNTGWESNPYNPLRNNVYTSASSGLPNVIDYLPKRHASTHPFFHSVPALSSSPYAPKPIVLQYQEKYVKKLLSISLNYGNVLYVINNEIPEDLEWGRYWVQFVRDEAKKQGKTVFVSDMRRNNDFQSSDQKTLLSDDFYDFFESSQNTGYSGQTHYDAQVTMLSDMAKGGGKTKPINNVKNYYTSTSPQRRMWTMIFANAASSRFHRPGYTKYHWGLGLNNEAQAMIKSMRMFHDYFSVFDAVPCNNLLGSRSSNEAYCMAKSGEKYAVYFPRGGSVTLNMGSSKGSWTVRWLNIDKSTWQSPTTVQASKSLTLNAPGSGQWVAVLFPAN